MSSHNAGYREVEQLLVKLFREMSGESYDRPLRWLSNPPSMAKSCTARPNNSSSTVLEAQVSTQLCNIRRTVQYVSISFYEFDFQKSTHLNYILKCAIWLVCNSSLSGSCAGVSFWRGATNNACLFAPTRGLLDAVSFPGSFVCSCNLVELQIRHRSQGV